MTDNDIATEGVRRWLAAQELAVRTAKRYEKPSHPSASIPASNRSSLNSFRGRGRDARARRRGGRRRRRSVPITRGGWGSAAIVATPVEEAKS